MLHTLLYIGMIAQLAHPYYAEREKAFTWLHEHPHRLILLGCKLHRAEIRIRSTELFEWYCEHSVRKLGVMPMLDSAWYDTSSKSYYVAQSKFLGKYEISALSRILEDTAFVT